MPSPVIVNIAELDFSYNHTPVLQNVNVEISAGEFVGIIGPNGGGKTTLLKLLMGFLKPTRGKIEIFGTAPKHAMGNIGYVPQRLPFDKQFPISVKEVVLTGRVGNLPWYGFYTAADRRAAEEALERVNLLPFQNVPFGSLSGGQAQRALIARAIVSNPKLLLLDEPTSSVDINAQSDIFDILNSLREEMTLLMVTHDLTAVIEHVQRILCVQGVVFPLGRDEVCKHFAFGLYHTPLIGQEQLGR